MKVFCSFATLVRFACWIAALCLIAGVALAHGPDEHAAPARGSGAGTALSER